MSIALRERLYRERGFVPVRLLGFRVVQTKTKKYEIFAQAQILHPCPRAGWRIDNKVSFFASLPLLSLEPLERPLELFAYFKAQCREEAKNRIDEFYRSGTMDGVPT